MSLSSGTSWDRPGATVIMRNSLFGSNEAELESGGVINAGEFCTTVVEGDGNRFELNNCYGDGGVIVATTDTSITIEGGLFINNRVGEVGDISDKMIDFGGFMYFALLRSLEANHQSMLGVCVVRFKPIRVLNTSNSLKHDRLNVLRECCTFSMPTGRPRLRYL